MVIVPLVTTGFVISRNLSGGKAWYSGMHVNSSNLILLGSGIAYLLFPTPEEGLFDKYLLAKSTYESR